MRNWNHNLKANDEEGREFANHLGYAILNCATIESLTYSYAATLENSHIFGTQLSGKQYSERVHRVEELLAEADIPDELRKRSLDLWYEAKEVMRKRNVIAHNPISRVRIERAEGEQEELMAVVDMAASTPINIQSLYVSKLANLASWASELAHKLEECLNDIQA